MYVQGHGKQYYIRRTGKQTGKLEAAVDKQKLGPVEHQKNRKKIGECRVLPRNKNRF